MAMNLQLVVLLVVPLAVCMLSSVVEAMVSLSRSMDPALGPCETAAVLVDLVEAASAEAVLPVVPLAGEA